VFRRWGPVLLIVAGIAGVAAFAMDVPAMREIYTAPVLGVLIALVVAVDAHRKLPAGSIVIALLVLTLLASALGLIAFGSALAMVGGTLIVVGLVELVLDEDEEAGDSWAGIAAFVPRRIGFGETAAQVRRVAVTAVLTEAVVDLSGLPEHVVEVRAACWGGTVSLVVPADRDVLIGSLTDHAVRFAGESDGIWDDSEPERPAVVLRTAGVSGSVFVRRTPVAAALEER
jgi:uncharacterized membrane protein